MEQLNMFAEMEERGQERIAVFAGHEVKVVTKEFWTAKQRQTSSLHEVSYRACFKPQLPRYFIQQYSSPGDIVYDPFSGRGTTAIEAALLGRVPYANDINPLSSLFSRPRISPPQLRAIAKRLGQIEYDYSKQPDIDLSMFYEKKTAAEIASLREYLLRSDKDEVDDWIKMVATNRLTGHSKGFFSVYSLPPNQAASQKRQIKINEKLKQAPEYRDTKAIILKKSKQLLGKLTLGEQENLQAVAKQAKFLNSFSHETAQISDASVQLIVTSPPFLNVVQYALDNWLRCWFNGIDAQAVAKNITSFSKLERWVHAMSSVFKELERVLKPCGYIAFEVGEVKKGTIMLDEHILPIGLQLGLSCEKILINSQTFTKTSNIWGVGNNAKGTNTNRIVLFKKR
ncbi:MAG: site-specific DNA-methyltransferase [Deltaproteobacteria bacterium]|nr:site-specific DNA-methyltransferase [Deltaproteobacteria bacterium]